MHNNSGTTLVTFRVRTPPHVRSLKLLGSWDNFSREYDMEKDTRLGNGYWTGCHTFTNIICDGQLESAPRKCRDGALKMGGTYWFHYRIDGEFDFYNEAEPCTTSCPFLPGQPVNILNVPVHLPSSGQGHRRDDSAASQTSIKETMNPEDKYLNPRPPPRPKLRLMTSQGLQPHEDTWKFPTSASPKRPPHGRSASHPREAQPRRKFRTGGKLNSEMRRPESAQEKINPIRAAFLNFAPPRLGGKNYDDGCNDTRGDEGKPGTHTAESRSKGDNRHLGAEHRSRRPAWCSNCSSPVKPPLNTSSQENLRQQDVRRPDTSNSRNPRRYVTPKHDQLRNPGTAGSTSCSGGDTDSFLVSCKLDVENGDTTGAVDPKTKRLPTLPNSPSSVLDEELAMTQNHLPDFEALTSHFSESSTVSPGSSPNGTAYAGGSRFSECAFESGGISPSSMTSTSTSGNDGYTPDANCPDVKILYPESAGATTPTHQDFHTAPNSRCKNIDSGNGSSPGYDYDLTVSGLFITKPPKSAGALKPPRTRSRHEHSSSPSLSPYYLSSSYHHLPSSTSAGDPYQSQEASVLTTPRVAGETDAPAEWNQQGRVPTMMQDLVDEMSYMANMIRDGGVENC